MNVFPWGVTTILSIGLALTAYIIYYILKLAYDEMENVSVQDQENKQDH